MVEERETFSTLDLLPDNLPEDAVTEEERERLALRRRLAADPLASRSRLGARRSRRHRQQYYHPQQRDGSSRCTHSGVSSLRAAPDADKQPAATSTTSTTTTTTSSGKPNADGHAVSSSFPSSFSGELSVFGYASTVFRDDEAAARVELGEYLIPWRNVTEDPIMLDRFDIRNLLDDRGAFPNDHREPTSSFEDEEERMCDVERYADVDSEEEDLWDMSEDERNAYVEAKREQRREAEEVQAHKQRIAAARAQVDYMLRIEISDDMPIPQTRRHLAIIEKTAKFLNDSCSNTNMEVVIQAKQANNPDFGFLNTHNELYPFYRHVRKLISAGTYVESSAKESKDRNNNSEDNSKDEKDSDESKLEDTNNRVSQKQPFIGQMPPPDVKIIIDKTAAFVARAGKALEQRLLERNADNPRFNFLNPWSQHHKYWKWALELRENTPVTATEAEGAAKEGEAERGL